MSGDAVDDRPARTTAVLAAVVAAAVAIAVGWAVGFGIAAVLGVLGGTLLAAGAWGLAEPARARQAGGSVAATAGAALLFGLFVSTAWRGDGWISVALWTGFAFVAVDAASGSGWERVRSFTSVLSENAKLLLVGVGVTAVLYLALVFGVVRALFGAVLVVSTSTPLAGFVTLQIFALCVALAVPRAVSVLEHWAGGDADDGNDGVLDSVESAGIRVSDVPRVYWIALAAQVVAAFVPQANRLFALFTGGLLGPVLTSGVLHGLLGLVFLALLAVFVAAVARAWIVAWLGAVPAQTLAVQAGGITSILVAVLVGIVVEYLPDNRVLDLLAPVVADRYGIVGLPAVVLVVLITAVVAVVLLLEVAPAVAHLGFAPKRATGSALGSALLFVATLAAAAAGAPAVVVFAGVAGAILAWDLGSHATSVGAELGRAADTRRSEFVHATGSVLVLGGAVVATTAARYAVVPATAPSGTQGTAGLAALSMILVLVALLAFVAAVHLRGFRTGS